MRTFLRQIIAELDHRADLNARADARKKWLAAINGCRRKWTSTSRPDFPMIETPIDPQRAALRDRPEGLPDDAILVAISTCSSPSLLGFCKPRRPDSLIGSMGFGPMGFGVAGVLGAKFAAPDRPCVSVCGDGAFFMHASVLGTTRSNIICRWSGWCGTTSPPGDSSVYASVQGGHPPAADGRGPGRGHRWPAGLGRRHPGRLRQGPPGPRRAIPARLPRAGPGQHRPRGHHRRRHGRAGRSP